MKSTRNTKQSLATEHWQHLVFLVEMPWIFLLYCWWYCKVSNLKWYLSLHVTKNCNGILFISKKALCMCHLCVLIALSQIEIDISVLIDISANLWEAVGVKSARTFNMILSILLGLAWWLRNAPNCTLLVSFVRVFFLAENGLCYCEILIVVYYHVVRQTRDPQPRVECWHLQPAWTRRNKAMLKIRGRTVAEGQG